MVVTGYVGTYDDRTTDSLRGNGKTLTMTYYLKKDHDSGRPTYTNYKTTFSTCLSACDIVDLMLSSEVRGASVGITEIQDVLDSMGTKVEIVKFIGRMVNQSRKKETDIRWDSQRYINVHKRLRVQSDMIIRPRKFHVDGRPCRVDRCPDPFHLIGVYVIRPYIPDPIKVLRAWVVGTLFDSNQILNETITVEDVRKTKYKNIPNPIPISIK